METKHTPTPWYLGMQPATIFASSVNGIDPRICQTDGGANNTMKEAKANAAFIVRAVNSHDELVAAIQTVIDCHNEGDFYDRGRKVHHLIGDLKFRVAKARGEA